MSRPSTTHTGHHAITVMPTWKVDAAGSEEAPNVEQFDKVSVKMGIDALDQSARQARRAESRRHYKPAMELMRSNAAIQAQRTTMTGSRFGMPLLPRQKQYKASHSRRRALQRFKRCEQSSTVRMALSSTAPCPLGRRSHQNHLQISV